MRVWRALIRVSLRSHFRISVLRDRYLVRKEGIWEPLLALLFLLCLLPFGSLILLFYKGIYEGLKWAGQADAFPVLTTAAGLVGVFIFGFFHIIGTLYFAKDSEGSLSLPVTPAQVFGARMIGVWIEEVLLLALIFLPGLLVYGWSEELGFPYYASLIPTMVILPLLPLSLAAVLAMGLMRVTHLRRSRSYLRAIGPFLGILLILGFQVLIRGDWMKRMEDTKTLGTWLTAGGLTETISHWLPPATWVGELLRLPIGGGGGVAWLLFLGVSLPAAIGAVKLADWLYYQGLLGGTGGMGGKRTRADWRESVGKESWPLGAMFRKEWRMLFRTSAFLLQAILGVLVFPLMMFVPMWVSGNGAQDVADLQSLPFMEELLIWSGVGAIAFLTGVNGVSVSSISREGKQFALSKSLPVSPGQQVLAKWLLAMVFTLFVIGVVVAMQILVGGGAWVLLWTLLLGSAAGAGMAGVGIVVNLMIPRLDWNTPQEAIRGGYNGLLMIMIQMVVAGLVALIVFLMKWLDVPDSLIYGSTFLLLLGGNYALYRGLGFLAGERYRKIEV